MAPVSATMDAYRVLAEAFQYPAPGCFERLEAGKASLPEGMAGRAYAAFVERLRGLSLGAWEELYTRTLDLNPPAAPYIGHHIWGERYERGAFLARLSRAMGEAGVDAGGELPDHLAPVLRYLGSTRDPMPELVDVLGLALDRMSKALRQADPGNPYIDLLEAVQALCQDLKMEEA